MGTRADFYVGRGVDAEWIGSIAWDGYRSGIPDDVLSATTEEAYREAVSAFLAKREDATLPEQGWPWPWDTSHTTDCCYAFDGDRVHCGAWGAWYSAVDADGDLDGEGDGERGEFPNMADRKAMTLGKRSGVIVFSMP